jgi:hypothetical protein
MPEADDPDASLFRKINGFEAGKLGLSGVMPRLTPPVVPKVAEAG